GRGCRPRPDVVRTGNRGAPQGGRLRAAARTDHGSDLSRAVGRNRARRLSRARAQNRTDAAAQALDRMEDRASHLTEESPQHGRGRLDVAVVGGGWAGCAAGVALGRAGVSVTLCEQSPTLGGRARRVTLDGMPFDNGQHVLVGAYRHTLGIIRRMPGGHLSALFHRRPVTIRPFGAARSDTVEVTAWSV